MSTMNDQFLNLGTELLKKPQPTGSTMKVTVNINPTEMFLETAKLYEKEIIRVMRFQSSPALIDAAQMTDYFNMLLLLRVCWVRNESTASIGSLKARDFKLGFRSYVIPALVYQLLMSVGEAFDQNFGLRFTPRFEMELEHAMSPDQMREISDKLSILSREGLVCVEAGIPTDVYGELAVMAIMFMEDKLMSYRMDHPINGFYASFLGLQLAGQLSNDMFRVEYGYLEDYRSILGALINKTASR